MTGCQVDYNGAPAGYTADPQENIVYVEAHDNETLFDIIQYKAPDDTTHGRPGAHAESGLELLVAVGQGVPFFHAGDGHAALEVHGP